MGRHCSWGAAVGPDVANLVGLFGPQVSAEILHKKFLWDGSQCTSWQNAPRRGSRDPSHLWLQRPTVSAAGQRWLWSLRLMNLSVLQFPHSWNGEKKSNPSIPHRVTEDLNELIHVKLLRTVSGPSA